MERCFFMNANETFVVVDLETTGQSVSKGGRIIQIGMTFIKNRKIVDHFDSFINPGRLIDRNIQQLTHISQKDVQNAPYFEELAPLLQNLLKDTVIIAHNVNFDYPYLNDEFERSGFPLLTVSAIDTVQLAQILLPTAPGYRLLDLTTYLHITLNNAHRANADAHATALLFLKLWHNAEQLPHSVLQQLQQGNWPLLRQTQDFLRLIKTKNKRSDLEIVDGMFIKKKILVANVENQKLPQYPTSVHQKFQLFGRWLTPNEAQNELMNRVNQFISKRSDGILTVLTAPKIGKTLGYLVPLILNHASRPIVLLTNDESLQIQQLSLVEKITKILDIKCNSAILYDAKKYIDINRFATLLVNDEGVNQTQIFKARVLVWLTQTNTGLLHEIQVGANNIDMVPLICGDEESTYFKRAQAKSKQADVLIMNFETYFNQATQLRQNRQLKYWPIVVMETPSQFVSNLKDYFHVGLPLTEIQQTLKELIHREIVGLTHKQRLFIKQGVSEALKIIKQIHQSNNTVANLKRTERLLIVLMHLSDIIKIGFVSIPTVWHDAEVQLVKIKRLQQQKDVIYTVNKEQLADQIEFTISFDILDHQIYQDKFIKHIHKLLIVSEYLDSDVSEFLRDVPKEITVEREFIHNETKPVQVIQMQKASPIIHLQAITQYSQGEILMIVPDESRVNHWYQKLRHTVTTNYNVIAEGVTGNLEKIQRQSHAEQANIMIVTPKIFMTMWLRDQELPAIVIVPEKSVWQPVSRLALVLTQMQRHESAMLITQLNAMQRHRFKSQINIMPNFNEKQNMNQSYSQIFKNF